MLRQCGILPCCCEYAPASGSQVLCSLRRVVARAEGMLMADELTGLAEHHFFGGPKPSIEGMAV